MRPTIEYRILGPFEVLVNGRPLVLGGRRERVLLVLLLRRNEPVGVEELIDELWGEQPPETAAKMVQNAIWQLRKALGEAGVHDVLQTRAGGYRLAVAPSEVDATRFEALVEQARAELGGGTVEHAAERLREALALWRGPALPEFAYEPFAEAEIARLEELRVAALEQRTQADLDLGRAAGLVGELEALVAQHPLRERLRAQLMVALYRSGRQAESLDVYKQTRRLLSEELGIEPSRALQELERAVLRQDPALDVAPASPPELPPAADAAPPTHAREVRKLVTVLVAGFEPAGGRADPEALRRPLSRAHAAALRVLERHGGHLEEGAGTTLVAVFGVPTVHEDDGLRAVRASLELREAISEAGAPGARGAGAPLALRLGIETGEAVVDGASIVAGDATTLAAGLARAARPGEILIGAATRGLVRGAVRTERVAGESELSSWRVVEILAGAPSVPRRRDARLVGRARELADLRQAYERAVRERTSYLFTLLGPAGIGKSRLTEEFGSSLRDEATLLAGRCVSYGEGVTFWPLWEMVRQAAGDDVQASVTELLAGLPDAALVADRLATTLGLAEGPGATEELFWAGRRLFEALGRERPLVLVFEDFHWAEPTLLDLVEHAAGRIRDTPVVMLCLARPELLDVRPSWGGGKVNSQSMLLEPLSPEESELLIDDLSSNVAIPAEARARVAQAAEGNPLFLEQMFHMLAEESVAGREVAVPSTIQALLGARLDRLPGDTRDVLQRASVIGKQFSGDALANLCPENVRHELERHLDALVGRELVRPWRSASVDEGFRFRHQLIRDVAYESLPKEARVGLHEQAAAGIEAASGQGEPEYDELVGYHLERSYGYRAELGLVDEDADLVATRAAERLAAAGRRAYARGDVPAAVALLSRAVALLPAEDGSRLEILADLGEARRDAGDFARADDALAEVAEAASAAGWQALEAQARVMRVRVRSQTDPLVTTDELLAEADRAIGVLEPLADDARLAKAWELRAWALWVRCHAADAEEALRRALEHARRAEDAHTEARSLNLLAGAALFGPTPVPQAISLCREILARPGEQRRVAASALRALAGLRAMEGAFDEARESLARSRAILDDLGLTVTIAAAAETSGIVELLAGDPVAAEHHLRGGYESLERIGETFSLSVLAALLAHALHAQERDAEALRMTAVSSRTAAEDDRSTQVLWRAAQAKVLARLGQTEEAGALARASVQLAAETDFLVVHGDALLDQAEVLAAAGRPQEASDAVERAVLLYDRKGSTVSAERARALIGRLATPAT